MTEDERSTIKAVAFRLLPLIFFLYFLSLVARSNLAVGALTMNRDLGIDTYTYSLGASIFFLGYIPFEIPSNVILDRVGARFWIGRITISMGLVACAMALVSGRTSFLIVRFLLGVAEAGLVPGMMVYLTYWFPSAYRARVNAAFLLAVPASNMIGAPIASSLLGLNGLLGLTGWQWMYILEGLPSVVFGFVVFRHLTDQPSKARWLTPQQREWLEARLAAERSVVEVTYARTSLWRGMADVRVLGLCLVYFAFGTATYGLIYYLPLFVKEWGLSNLATGWTVAVPDSIGVAGMLIWGYWSDRVQDRRWSLVAALLIATAGLVGMGLFGASAWSLIAVAMVSVGINAGRPMFLALPPAFLSRTAMAGAFALISCFANIGGLIGTLVIGWIKTTTNSFAGGLYYISALTFVGAVIVLFGLGSITSRVRSLTV